ncbi:MAG: hypothetical protein H7235_04350 [Bdellovibrionaceae bacterium]|nr:hypothetical protein [Pseudobdellovibrionaceae bacterium]
MTDKTINERKENIKTQKTLDGSPLRMIQGDFDSLGDEERRRINVIESDYLLRIYIEAEAYYQANCFEKSKQMLEVYVKLYEKNDLAWNRLGTLMYESDDLVKANYFFEKAVMLSPDDPDYVFNYSTTLYDLGLFAQAHQTLIKFFNLRPEARITIYYNWFISDYAMSFVKNAWKTRHELNIKIVNDEPLTNGKAIRKGQS